MNKFWAGFWTYVRANLISAQVKSLVVAQVVKLAAGSLGGWQLKIVTFIVKKLVAWGWAEAKHFVIIKETGANNEVGKDKYEEIINKPEVTHEEIKDAAPGFIGGDIKH